MWLNILSDHVFWHNLNVLKSYINDVTIASLQVWNQLHHEPNQSWKPSSLKLHLQIKLLGMDHINQCKGKIIIEWQDVSIKASLLLDASRVTLIKLEESCFLKCFFLSTWLINIFLYTFKTAVASVWICK